MKIFMHLNINLFNDIHYSIHFISISHISPNITK